MPELLAVRHLTTRFHTPEGVVHAVSDASFTVGEGEIVGVVGESGSGKSVTMLSLLRLIPEPPGKIESGEVRFAGRDLLALDGEELRRIRGVGMAMVFQDPMTSLNPVLSVGLQLTEVLTEHLELDRRGARQRAAELLESVGISQARDRLSSYPHEFSGGMRQRVMIAMALACDPSLLIADEPTTALDVTIQADIVDLVEREQTRRGMSVIWISHDLGVVARLAHRVLVMYGGRIVEEATVRHLFRTPRHPYALGLLGSLPRLDGDPDVRLTSIPGQPPTMVGATRGCPFAPRCGYAVERCRAENPRLTEVAEGHRVACWQIAETEGAWQGER